MRFKFPWQKDLASLQRKIDNLSKQVDNLARQLAQLQPAAAWSYTRTAAPDLVPSRGVRSGRLAALEARKIFCVTINRFKDVVAYDQAGIPIREYCGPFRQVGVKILAIYTGRWLQVDDETGQHKVIKLPVTPAPEMVKA